MQKHRTLREDERGFITESGKRRNLLNSAGGDVRRGSLGHRRTARALSDMTVTLADGTRTIVPRIRRHARIAPVPAQAVEVSRIRTKRLSPPRHPLHRYLDYLDRFPNVLAQFRARPTTPRIVEISFGAGRGW